MNKMDEHLDVEYLPIEDVTMYDNNPNDHPDEQVDDIVASMQEYGWTIPILIDDDNVVIAGHGRMMAAEQLGYDTVPVIRRKNLSDEQARGYRIADNRFAQGSIWNFPKLRVELSDLRDKKFNIRLTGFTEKDLEGMALPPNLRSSGDDQPDMESSQAKTHTCPECGHEFTDDDETEG